VGFMTIDVVCSGAMPAMFSVGASLLGFVGVKDGVSTTASASAADADGPEERSEAVKKAVTNGKVRNGQLYGAMSVISSVTHAIQAGVIPTKKFVFF